MQLLSKFVQLSNDIGLNTLNKTFNLFSYKFMAAVGRNFFQKILIQLFVAQNIRFPKKVILKVIQTKVIEITYFSKVIDY